MRSITPYRDNDKIVTQVISMSEISDKLTTEQKDAIVQAWNWNNSKTDVMRVAEKVGVPRGVAAKAYKEMNDLCDDLNGVGNPRAFGFGVFGGWIGMLLGLLPWMLLVGVLAVFGWLAYITLAPHIPGGDMPLVCIHEVCYWLR